MCAPGGRDGEGVYSRYGTLLGIRNMTILQDGRALVSTVGICAFEVLDRAMHDDYHIARVDRIADVNLDHLEAPLRSGWRAWGTWRKLKQL